MSSAHSATCNSVSNDISPPSFRAAAMGPTATWTQQRSPAMDDLEDGPLFRATIAQLAGRTSTMKAHVKRIIKAAQASLEAQRVLLAADQEFVEALRDIPAVDPLFAHYLNDTWPKAYEQRERLQHSMQSLLIDPLQKLYEMDIKVADAKQRQFEEESKEYYASLAKYLSIKTTDSAKRTDSEAKHMAKKRHFDLTRFDYYSFLVDLHGGKKSRELLYHLLSYQQKEYAFYQSITNTLEANKPGLDELATMMADASREQNLANKERYEKRKILESKVAEVASDMPTHPVSSESAQRRQSGFQQHQQQRRLSTDEIGDRKLDDIVAIGTDSNVSSERKVGVITGNLTEPVMEENKFRGIRDLEQQDRELIAGSGRRKEGFLFATSKPLKNSAFDKTSGAVWHKYWCVLSSGQLHEYCNWKSQLQTHIDPINLKFATVREARNTDRRFCFEVITTNFRRVYQATSQEEMQSWIATINNSIESVLNGMSSSVDLVKELDYDDDRQTQRKSEQQLPQKSSTRKIHSKSLSGALRSGLSGKDKSIKKRHSNIQSGGSGDGKFRWAGLGFGKSSTGSSQPKPTVTAEAQTNAHLLSQLKEDPSNAVCADCGEANPEWCSLNLGILLCIECSGIHRSLGTHISKVRSLTLDSTSYTPDLIALLRELGNARSNAIWEATLGSDLRCRKPTPDSTREVKSDFIQAKYVRREFVQEYTGPGNRYNLLFEAIRKDDIPGAMYAIAIGLDVNGSIPSCFNSPRILLLDDTSDIEEHPLKEPSAEVEEHQQPVGSTLNKSLSDHGIDFESIRKELDMSYFFVRYPLHFALLHGRVANEDCGREHVYPMAELLLQNGADTSMVDLGTGCTLGELVGMGSVVDDDAIEYLNAKNAARGQSPIVRASASPASRLSGESRTSR